jgi:hypothetical protein
VLVELDLGVERLLANPDRERARARDRIDDDRDLLVQRRGRHDAVDEAPVQCGGGIDRPAGEEHVERTLAADRARERDHRRRAEQPDLDAGGREARAVRRDGEVAGGHELAARRGGDALHLRDDGLREAMDRLHQLGAHVEEALEEGDVAADHLAEVVAGRKRRTGGVEDDDPHAGVGAHAPQRARQVLHELEAQGVALVGSVEGDVHRRLVLVDEHGGVGGERAHGADDTPVAIGRRAA